MVLRIYVFDLRARGTRYRAPFALGLFRNPVNNCTFELTGPESRSDDDQSPSTPAGMDCASSIALGMIDRLVSST